MDQYKQRLEYLDDVMTKIFNSKHQITKHDLQELLDKEEMGDSRYIVIHNTDSTLLDAINYLQSESLIITNDIGYAVSYKGILKLSKGGFSHEYIQGQIKIRKEEDQYERLERFHKSSTIRNWSYVILTILSLIISSIALCVSICR